MVRLYKATDGTYKLAVSCNRADNAKINCIFNFTYIIN